VKVERVIDAPAARVWEVLTRLAYWPEWGPSVREVRCDEEAVREGLVGRLRTPLGVWVPFEVTEVEPGRRWRWRVWGREATGHEVEPLGPTRCLLRFTMPAWALPYALVCEVALRRIEAIATS
jgi:uncharacterized protein YndB with AHSA1/START domain